MNFQRFFHLGIIIYFYCLLVQANPALSQGNVGQPSVPQSPTSTTATPSAPTPTSGNLSKPEPESIYLEWFKAFVPLAQSVAWPIAFSLLLLVFRTQINQLTNTLTSRMQSGKVKVFGAEFEITNVTNTEEFKELVKQKSGEKPIIYGNPDMFQLLFKATSPSLSKSTKVLNVPNGCVVQVTTKEVAQNGTLSVAEAVTFIPGININIIRDEKNRIIKTEFINLS